MLAFRRFTLVTASFLLLTLSGCGTVEDQQGDTVRYTNRSEAVWLMLATGLGFAALGGFWVVQDRRHYQTLRARAKKLKQDPNNIPYEGGTGKAWGAFLGGLLLIVGGVPGVMNSHVTVTPDEATISDTAFWFVPNNATIRLADVRDVSDDVEEKLTKRGTRRTEYLNFHMADGSVQRVKVAALVRAARERILANIQASRAKGQPQIAVAPQGQPPADLAASSATSTPSGTANPLTGTPPVGSPPASGTTPAPPGNTPPQGTPVTATTFVAPGMMLESQFGGQWLRVEVLAVLPDGKVRIHWVGYADSFDEDIARDRLRLPATAPGTVATASASSPNTAANAVTAATPLARGAKLEAEWAGKWLPVEVLEVLPNGTVKIHWTDYSDSFDEALPRSRLRLAPKQ